MLTGWAIDHDALRGAIANSIQMRPWTAVALVLGALATAALQVRPTGRPVARLIGGVLLVVGSTLYTLLFVRELDIMRTRSLMIT